MSHIASSHADQPEHVAHQVVPLAALDLVYGPRRGDDGRAAGFELSITPVEVRAAKMDEFGVGYELEIRNNKAWKRAVLSRRNFGIDNFTPEAQANHWGTRVLARVWFWEADQAAAEAALRGVACHSLERLEESIAAAMHAIRATDASPSARPR